MKKVDDGYSSYRQLSSSELVSRVSRFILEIPNPSRYIKKVYDYQKKLDEEMFKHQDLYGKYVTNDDWGIYITETQMNNFLILCLNTWIEMGRFKYNYYTG